MDAVKESTLPDWFTGWVKGIYQSPWITDFPFDYLVKHIINNNFYNHDEWLSIHHLEAINYVIGYNRGWKTEGVN